jgi:2-keto-4-pentenoate hydratase
MSSTEQVVAELADRLWRAEVERVPVEPISQDRPDLTIDDGYAIQTRNVTRRVTAGSVVRGRKVGLTSRKAQKLMGVDEPDFGVLLDDMFLDDAAEVPFDALLQPRVVSVMAFVMASDLVGPGITTADVLTAVSGVLPAIEVVDSRIADWRTLPVDTAADNASAGRIVLGGRLTPVAGIDLRLEGLLLYRNGAPIESAAGAAALGSPARSIAWLANKLGTQGSGLRRGDVVLPGALHRMVPVRAGDYFQAHFAHLGTVTAQFSDGAAA